MSTPQTYRFHLLAKPSGAICNLDCKYCFFLSKENLYPNSKFHMSNDLLEQYIKQLLEAHEAGEVTIAWQGGEPTLMGLDFFKLSLELVAKYRKPGQLISHTIQTNGTRLTQEWAEFFADNKFLVGLSVDGPQPLHDAYRVYKSGKGSFEKVMQGWNLLQNYQVEVNILCTVHAANAEHPLEVYRFFRDELEIKFIQFIPIIERTTEYELPLANLGWSKRPGTERPLYTQKGWVTTDRSVTAKQYGRFMIAIFEEWVRKDIGEIYVQAFDVALASRIGIHSLCVFSPTCGNALALEHNGDLYSCDHYVEPDYLLGNIQKTHLAELLSSAKQQKFGQDKCDTLPTYCQQCEVKFACYGGCPKDRFITTPDGEPGLNYLCEGYKMFFQHINQPMEIMAKLLRANRAPAEIMQWYAHQDKINANV